MPGNVKEEVGRGGPRGRWGASNGCQWAECELVELEDGDVAAAAVDGGI